MMFRSPKLISVPLAVQSVLVLVAAGGCGDSGANVRPTVVARPATKGGGAVADGSTATGGTKAADGGAADTAPAKGGFGHFAGRVVFKGPPPKLDPLITKGATDVKDPAVCAAMDVPNESLIVAEDGGIANVFLYLKRPPAGGKSAPPPEEPVLFDQKFCRFIPHAMAVRVNQTVDVVNGDNVSHNTNIKPKNAANPSLNTILTPLDRKGVPIVYVAQEVTPVFVKCDIHNWMTAYHMPVGHSYFAVTDTAGRFEIKDLPAGRHSFVVWHEKGGQLNSGYEVTITDGQTTEQELSFEPAKFTKYEGPAPRVLTVRASY